MPPRLRLVGRPLQKLERHKVAILVEEIQSHNQDMQKPPLSNHGPPSGRKGRTGSEDGREGEREREQDMGRGTHTTPAKVQRLRKKGREGRAGLNKFQMRTKSPAPKRQRGIDPRFGDASTAYLRRSMAGCMHGTTTQGRLGAA